MNLTTFILAALLSQVSGEPFALVACPAGERTTDGEHVHHTCPAAIAVSDCWWLYHGAVDGHGHAVKPFLDEEVLCARAQDRAPDCGQAADRRGDFCVAHVPVLVREGAAREFCQRFYPHDSNCAH